MDREALNRNLRELSKLECFEYVPPFRGRAIHFRRRDIPFADLKIDHETLAARKKADYEKLDKMVAFAQSRACRQRTILEYFGDGSAANCGICDRCQGKSGWPKMPEIQAPKKATASIRSPEIAEVPKVKTKKQPTALELQQSTTTDRTIAKTGSNQELNPLQNKVDALLPTENKACYDLICTIIRAIERTHGYLSKTILTQHLQGVENKAIQGLRLQRLPEFGILSQWKKSHAAGFLDQNLDLGLLDLSELRVNKVTVCVSEKGKRCLEGTEPIPEPLMKYVHHCISVADKGPKKREQESLTAASTTSPAPLPATLHTPLPSAQPMPSAQPKSFTQPIPLPPPSKTEDDRPVRSLDALPVANVLDARKGREGGAPMMEDWRWTVRMVEHGYRLGEIALIRGKTPDAILEDLTHALNNGSRFAIDNLFDRRTQIALRELQESDSRTNVPPSGLQSYPSLWNFVQRWLAKGISKG